MECSKQTISCFWATTLLVLHSHNTSNLRETSRRRREDASACLKATGHIAQQSTQVCRAHSRLDQADAADLQNTRVAGRALKRDLIQDLRRSRVNDPLHCDELELRSTWEAQPHCGTLAFLKSWSIHSILSSARPQAHITLHSALT